MTKVMVFGTFDILHLGHIKMFKEARSHGDHLTVLVSRDKRAENVKGIKLIHTEEERLKIISHIDLVDQAILGDKDDVYAPIKEVNPDVIALGYDQEAFVDNLKSKIEELKLKARVVRLSSYGDEKYKSSKIKNKLYELI